MSSLKKCSKFCRRLELGNGVKFLKGACKGVGQAPHRPRCELLVLRIEVPTVDYSGQVSGNLQFSLDERSINDELRGLVRKLP